MYKASDAEVDAQIEMLRKNLAKLKPVKEKRSAKEDDFVIIDYEGFKDGKPFDETPKDGKLHHENRNKRHLQRV